MRVSRKGVPDSMMCVTSIVGSSASALEEGLLLEPLLTRHKNAYCAAFEMITNKSTITRGFNCRSKDICTQS
jgi:hypothetical protein